MDKVKYVHFLKQALNIYLKKISLFQGYITLLPYTVRLKIG